MNRNLNRRIHPIAEADGLSPKKPRNLEGTAEKSDFVIEILESDKDHIHFLINYLTLHRGKEKGI